MSCNCCFEDWVCNCITDDLIINTRLTPGEVYFWQVEDKFGHKYSGEVIAETNGTIIIPIADLPDGMINQYNGGFKIKLFSDLSCAPISFPLTKNYDCIDLEVRGGTQQKDTIGCETPCASGTGETAIVPFTNVQDIELDWADYVTTLGNNPLIQVYHNVSGDVYQQANVTVQQIRVNGVLTTVIINNAGPATGYILITA